MSTIYTFIAVLIITIGLTSSSSASPAVIEMGSGVTSVYFASTDRKLEPILYQTMKIPFAKDLVNYQKITKKTERLAIETLNRFKNEASSKGADSYIVVATEAFRKAPNAIEVLHCLEQETGLTIKVLSVEEEAELGFQTASLITNIPSEKLVVFDMGSGSIQWAQQSENREIDSVSKPLGTTVAVDLFKRIRPGSTSENIYPVTPEELAQFIALLTPYIKESFINDAWQYDQNKQAVGIGFVQLVAIGMKEFGLGTVDKDANTITITADEINQALELITSNDREVREDFIKRLTRSGAIWLHPAIPSIALLYTLMKQAGFEKITCSLNKDLVGNGIAILNQYELQKG